MDGRIFIIKNGFSSETKITKLYIQKGFFHERKRHKNFEICILSFYLLVVNIIPHTHDKSLWLSIFISIKSLQSMQGLHKICRYGKTRRCRVKNKFCSTKKTDIWGYKIATFEYFWRSLKIDSLSFFKRIFIQIEIKVVWAQFERHTCSVGSKKALWKFWWFLRFRTVVWYKSHF